MKETEQEEGDGSKSWTPVHNTLFSISFSLLKPHYFLTVKMLMISSGKPHVNAIINYSHSFCIICLCIKNILKMIWRFLLFRINVEVSTMLKVTFQSDHFKIFFSKPKKEIGAQERLASGIHQACIMKQKDLESSLFICLESQVGCHKDVLH